MTKKSLRLALIASEDTLWAYSIFLERLLVGLADESIPVILVCPAAYDTSSLLIGNVEIVKYPVYDLPFTEHINRKLLIERLEKFRPTVLHCLCESRASLTKRLSRRLKLPYILMINSLSEDLGRLSVSSERCVKIIAPTKSIAIDIAGAYPRIAERVESINVGSFVPEDHRCFSGFSSSATLGMACYIDDASDFENLFGAVRHLIIEGYEFMMIVAGEGQDEGPLRELLTALGLLRIVSIVPNLRPLRSVLATCDIFIHPQPSGHFNPLLLEAMSVGCATAACKGGVDDLIIENKTAIVFDPEDELSIVGALQKLLDKHDLARKIAGFAQQHVKENYTVGGMISSTLQIYEQAQCWKKI